MKRPIFTPAEWSAHVGYAPPPEYKGVVPLLNPGTSGICHHDPISNLMLEVTPALYYMWWDYTPPSDAEKDKKS